MRTPAAGPRNRRRLGMTELREQPKRTNYRTSRRAPSRSRPLASPGSFCSIGAAPRPALRGSVTIGPRRLVAIGFVAHGGLACGQSERGEFGARHWVGAHPTKGVGSGSTACCARWRGSGFDARRCRERAEQRDDARDRRCRSGCVHHIGHLVTSLRRAWWARPPTRARGRARGSARSLLRPKRALRGGPDGSPGP